MVYPGVGAIRDCIGELKSRGLDELILEIVNSKPMLAICVGMQGLMRRSEENDGIDCLNVLPYDVVYFGDHLLGTDGSALKVPHMGWNTVKQTIAHPLWKGIDDNAHFYFVHSYCVRSEGCAEIAGLTRYGFDIVSAVSHNNVFAVQFHPEKSHTNGLQLLNNFMQWDGQA